MPVQKKNLYNADWKQIGKRLKRMREKAGLSQKDLAEMLDVSPSTISKYETARDKIPVDLLLHLSDYFGSSIDYIITGRRKTSAGVKAEVREVINRLMKLEGEIE